MGTRGPQPLPEHLKRRHRVGVWMNEVELSELESLLAQPGLADLVMNGGADARKGLKRASEYLRDRALGRRVRMTVPALNKKAYAELGRIGGNVNQIAASINSRMLKPGDSKDLEVILVELRELREALLGVARDGFAVEPSGADDSSQAQPGPVIASDDDPFGLKG